MRCTWQNDWAGLQFSPLPPRSLICQVMLFLLFFCHVRDTPSGGATLTSGFAPFLRSPPFIFDWCPLHVRPAMSGGRWCLLSVWKMVSVVPSCWCGLPPFSFRGAVQLLRVKKPFAHVCSLLHRQRVVAWGSESSYQPPFASGGGFRFASLRFGISAVETRWVSFHVTRVEKLRLCRRFVLFRPWPSVNLLRRQR